MSANRYTINPLTGRTIRVGGLTFNQLVIEAYDYLDSGLKISNKRWLSNLENTAQFVDLHWPSQEEAYLLLNSDVQCVSQDDELTFAFTRDYEYQLEYEEFELIKIWLLKQINGSDRDVEEKVLYRLLFDLYAEKGINEPFAVFYDIYYDKVNNPLSKNFVFHTLKALSLVMKMSRIVVDGREKSIISINATREELLELFKKNGIDY
ncbi:hypothetical protein RclHR1_20990008 [Rhizophagus clarus]|uniref:Uncharacterized protein n=1 Tax=Rhizophagus clarus TaxID=94130 RepID=A0A2Z6R5C2_9GLOM|nr:hypothetical protein RclHR1_20990008 [Rhizophagus clarus]